MKCECGAFWENSWKAEGEDENLNTPISKMANAKDLGNLDAQTSAQLSNLPLVLSLIYIRYYFIFKMMCRS